LLLLARAALRRGVPVVAVSPRPSFLAPSGPAEGLLVVDGDDDDASLEAALDGSHRHPPLVLVDDVEQVDGGPLEPRLLRLLGPDRSRVEGVAVAGTTTDLAARFRGLGVEARRARTGLLLSPTGYADGDLLGVVVPRARSLHPGRGVLVLRGSAQPVQVALPVG
jgi:S-DNA-T family DNA segregation ATPase FtsK/SpoIIIE